jgi:glutathione S-transferase
MSLTVWGRLSSINVQKVMWTLEEIGLAYEHIPAGGSFGLLDSPAFKAMNPHGWVPVIDDDGTIVWESNVIVRYLCAEHSKALWPATPRLRSQADQWMEWTATTLQPAVMGFFWGWYRTPEAQRNASRNAAFLRAAGEAWARLDALLAHRPYVAGDHLTMGDIPAGTLLYRWYGLEIDRPALANVEAWYGRLQERPAYRAQVMRPFEELFARLAY